MESQINFSTGFLKAAADYSAKQFYILKADSTARQAVLCGAGEAAIGVLVNEPASGKPCVLVHNGVCLVYAGNTVTAGNALMSDANGKAVPHTGTNKVIGIALEGASANQAFLALITCSNVAGASVNYGAWSFYLNMALIANGDIITAFTPGFAGTITKVFWVQETPVTTAAKASALNLEIGTTNVTGGVVSLTSAACTPLGAVIAGTAITANNTFGASDTISVEASSTTTFIEGAGTLVIEYSC